MVDIFCILHQHVYMDGFVISLSLVQGTRLWNSLMGLRLWFLTWPYQHYTLNPGLQRVLPQSSSVKPRAMTVYVVLGASRPCWAIINWMGSERKVYSGWDDRKEPWSLSEYLTAADFWVKTLKRARTFGFLSPLACAGSWSLWKLVYTVRQSALSELPPCLTLHFLHFVSVQYRHGSTSQRFDVNTSIPWYWWCINVTEWTGAKA